jgi:hypothetical protein
VGGVGVVGGENEYRGSGGAQGGERVPPVVTGMGEGVSGEEVSPPLLPAVRELKLAVGALLQSIQQQLQKRDIL